MESVKLTVGGDKCFGELSDNWVLKRLEEILSCIDK